MKTVYKKGHYIMQKLNKKFIFMIMDAPAHLDIVGQLDKDTTQRICSEIREAHSQECRPDYIVLNLCSPGGDSWSRNAIISAMRMSQIPIWIYASGVCGSYALDVAMSGHKGYRIISELTEVVCHQGTTSLPGNWSTSQLNSLHNDMRFHEEQRYDLYEKLTNLNRQKINELLFPHGNDAYLTPEQCVDYGLFDHCLKS